MKLTLKQIVNLWEKLGDIPTNNNDKITETFKTPISEFKKGTSRLDIWHWFDEQLECNAPEYSINDLMFHKIKV